MNKNLRIISLLPSATEIICALGLRENLVGVTHECDFPQGVENLPHLTASRISHETMSSKEIDHAVRSQLDGHGSIYDLDVELLEKLKPDLIITQELCEVCAVAYPQVEKAARMYSADAQVVSLEPNTIEDIFENIKTVGDLTDSKRSGTSRPKSAKSSRKIENSRKPELNQISKFNRPRVFMLEWLEPPFAPGHWTPQQVEFAGGNCILGEAGKKSATTTYQAIYESKPEKIVLVPCGYYTEDILRQMENTFFPENWRELPAIENGEVWALDASSYFSRPAPRVVDGAEILAKIFHPEIFGAPSETEAVRVSKDLIKYI